jgi:tetratricopeptide (TPR) repeat protein
MEALIAFSWYRCETKPSLEIADHAVMAAKASGVQRYIATAMWCLGWTCFQLGDHHISYNHLKEAYQLFNTLPPGDFESQRLVGLCGIDLVDNARFILQDDEVVSLARDVEKKCSALSDDLVHGRSLVILGIVLRRARQPQEALCYMHNARTMFKALGNAYNLAGCYQVISWVHFYEHRLPDALDALEEAWKYAALTSSRYIQTNISYDLSRTLFGTNQDTKAWKYLEISLMNASYIGDRLHVARALDYMGYGYLRRGDYQNAYGAYEAAAEKYLGTIDADDSEVCKNNMARIKEKQGNPDTVVGFYRPTLDIDIDIDETLFYPPVQALASELPVSDS